MRTSIQRFSKPAGVHIGSVASFSTLDYVNAAENDVQFETLVELQEKACVKFKDRGVLGTLSADKTAYNWMTYGEFGVEVQRFRNVLGGHLNFQFDDKTAIVSNNRYEWVVAMYATMSLGGQIVPMYEQSTEADWKYIIEDSDAKVLIISSEVIFNKVKDYIGKVGLIESSFSLSNSLNL